MIPHSWGGLCPTSLIWPTWLFPLTMAMFFYSERKGKAVWSWGRNWRFINIHSSTSLLRNDLPAKGCWVYSLAFHKMSEMSPSHSSKSFCSEPYKSRIKGSGSHGNAKFQRQIQLCLAESAKLCRTCKIKQAPVDSGLQYSSDMKQPRYAKRPWTFNVFSRKSQEK